LITNPGRVEGSKDRWMPKTSSPRFKLRNERMKYMQVIVKRPEHVPLIDAKDYIIKELASAGGCRRTDDPLFEGLEVVSVKPIRVEIEK